MGSGESFDPRTWKRDDSTRPAAPVATPTVDVTQTVSGARFRWWLGPLLSALVLAAGALAAYETRTDNASAEATAVSAG